MVLNRVRIKRRPGLETANHLEDFETGKLEAQRQKVVEDGVHGEGGSVSSGGSHPCRRRHDSHISRLLLLLAPCDVIT